VYPSGQVTHTDHAPGFAFVGAGRDDDGCVGVHFINLRAHAGKHAFGVGWILRLDLRPAIDVTKTKPPIALAVM